MQNTKNLDNGSSETTREKILTQFDFNDFIQYGKPSHLKDYDITFLEWFIGFFEAEGSFCCWIDGKRTRFNIDIGQKDPKLMYKIRKTLGFGRVTCVTERKGNPPRNETYWRYNTTKKECLLSFIYLFNGNLVSHQKHQKFKTFVTNFNQHHKTNFVVSNQKRCLSFETAWLSGFLEGDGGFYACSKNLIYFKQDGSKSYNIHTRFYVTQKGNLVLLKRIKKLCNISSQIYQFGNGHTLDKYNRLETRRLECLQLIIIYLDKYPFLGQRKIKFSRWKRVVDYRLNNYPITDKSIAKLKRLIKGTK